MFRRPITTLDDHLAAGLRVDALRAVVERFEPRGEPDEDAAVLDDADLAFRAPVLRPPSLRDFYAFERHVGTMWARRGGEIPEAWFRLPIFYFSNVSEIRGPGDPVWAPRGSTELDYELEVAALVDTPARDLATDGAEAVIGGYLILNDWSARDLQREETTVRLGPAKGKDFASSIGPWLVTPDELSDRRAGAAFELEMTATVNGSKRAAAPGQHPFLVRPDAGTGLGRRPPPARRPAGQRHGRRWLPARDPRGDDRTLPRAGRRGCARDRTAGELRSPIVARP